MKIREIEENIRKARVKEKKRQKIRNEYLLLLIGENQQQKKKERK